MEPSTPIDECDAAIDADELGKLARRTPPYDGVRVYGDLIEVRARLDKAKAKDKHDTDE